MQTTTEKYPQQNSPVAFVTHFYNQLQKNIPDPKLWQPTTSHKHGIANC